MQTMNKYGIFYLESRWCLSVHIFHKHAAEKVYRTRFLYLGNTALHRKPLNDIISPLYTFLCIYAYYV